LRLFKMLEMTGTYKRVQRVAWVSAARPTACPGDRQREAAATATFEATLAAGKRLMMR
jgi:hypothetical protein